MTFDREQLDALRRQVEEDYRLDMAAIERLQRRYLGAPANMATSTFAPPSNMASGSYSSPSNLSGGGYPAPSNGSGGEGRATVLPPLSSQSDAQDKELSGALRSMFKAQPSGRG